MKEKSVAQLIQVCQTKFNAFVRRRDEGLPCISCGAPHPTDAGHLFPKSTRPAMRFVPEACFLQCRRCNGMHDGNYENMCKGIAARHGVEYLQNVIQMANDSRKETHKWSKSELLDLIAYFDQQAKILHER